MGGKIKKWAENMKKIGGNMKKELKKNAEEL